MAHPVDQLIERYGVEQVTEAARPLLTDGRRERIERVLDARLASVTVVLENLHDPHNGAAAIRSIESLGLTQLHVVESTEPFRFSSTVTIGCQKWISVRRHRSIPECAAELSGAGFALYATVPDAPDDLETIDVDQPFAVLFGNERDGLSDEAIAVCDRQVSMPMYGFTQSFNLSVSVALATRRLADRRRAAIGALGDLPDQERAFLRARWYALGIRGAEHVLHHHVSNGTQPSAAATTRPDENH